MMRSGRVLAGALLAMCLVMAMVVAVAADTYDIAVFVPGVVAGSPLYEQLVAGVNQVAAENSNVTVKVLEAGFDQSTWEQQMVSLAATQEYELIVSSNGSMPDVSLPAADAFPDQKFLIFDAVAEGNPQMYTVLYNQVEQAGVMGYLAGLVTTSDMAGANADLKVGFIAGQQYEAMDNMMVPGYELGAQLANPGISVDFRVIGNWYDANKASDLANSMFDAGVDIILTACGGANQGVIQAAQDRGKYVLYMDDEHYDLAPGTIVGCGVLKQQEIVYEKVTDALAGNIQWGSYEILNMSDGYVDFPDTNPLYISSVSEAVRAKLAVMLGDLRSSYDTWLKAQMVVPKYW
jgi:basic membrane lipoprotein Med (substrate-binding protein (PBP1-ABC) superfamily)